MQAPFCLSFDVRLWEQFEKLVRTPYTDLLARRLLKKDDYGRFCLPASDITDAFGQLNRIDPELLNALATQKPDGSFCFSEEYSLAFLDISVHSCYIANEQDLSCFIITDETGTPILSDKEIRTFADCIRRKDIPENFRKDGKPDIAAFARHYVQACLQAREQASLDR